MPRSSDVICTVVTMPNSYDFVVEVPKNANGYFVFDKVCEKLKLLQKDFFGLQMIDEENNKRWLNLRNLVVSEVGSSYPFVRFLFGIKFFVQTHYLLQERTREIFFQLARNQIIETKEPPLLSENLLNTSLTILAQYYNNGNSKHSNLEDENATYKTVLQKLTLSSKTTDNSDLLANDLLLKEASRNEIRTLFLRNMSHYMNAIGHRYTAELDRESVVIGVLPGGISFLSSCLEPLRSYPWCSLQQATQNGLEVNVKVISDDLSIKTLKFLLHNKSSANAFYRDLTEVYTFFHCDSVAEPVMQQFCRDFKGTFAALFVDNSDYGKEYIFDIEHTLKESDDRIRRHIYKEERSKLNENNNKNNNNNNNNDNNNYNTDTDHSNHSSNSKSLVEYRLPSDFDKENSNNNTNDCAGSSCKADCKSATKLNSIRDSFLCCICADREISTSLDPCGHAFTCYECSDRIDSCPICKRDVLKVIRLYLPHSFYNRVDDQILPDVS